MTIVVSTGRRIAVSERIKSSSQLSAFSSQP
jgi:hypothetical protein